MLTFPGNDWFDHASFHVSCHSHDGTVKDGHAKSAVYTISIRNKLTPHTKLHVTKSDFDFEAFRDRVSLALDHGHVCPAACPWYFVDMTTHIPKRRVLTSATSKSAIAAHIQMFQDLLNHTVAFMRCPESRFCSKPTDVLPPLVFDFLFANVDDDGIPHGLLDTLEDASCTLTALKHKSPRHTYHTQKQQLERELCAVCKITLRSEATHELAIVGISTLPCKHAFHDECIVVALNASDSLDCPSCVTDDDSTDMRGPPATSPQTAP
ncbi:Aste57867_13450 [Aphanomyces stellatus]|uniref:Aste57867_13450 protein n=1 Tax=Aphanomyces stellatus TaxID=120398 RepID=A0A485KZU9_9STRA|nr:hypothetical protein As57867_013400 [Aphanomyces stellatus]VFT90288.1 Aste57867_13450 [Aphanomyces stellatus]